MSAYFVLKLVHILSAAVLAGTGFGIAFFKWIVDRTGNISAIRIVSEKVVLAAEALSRLSPLLLARSNPLPATTLPLGRKK